MMIDGHDDLSAVPAYEQPQIHGLVGGGQTWYASNSLFRTQGHTSRRVDRTAICQ